jgi:hypothetical protein
MGGIRHAGGFESTPPNAAGVATAARAAELVRLVTGHRSAKIHAQPQALANNLRLRPADEWSVHAAGMAFDSGARCKGGHFLKRAYELRTAVRIAPEIKDIYADENVV